MMKFLTPSTISLPDDSDKVKRFLSFTDNSIQFQIKKLKDMYHWAKSDPEGYNERLESLKLLQKKILLKYDSNGTPYTYAGLWQDLESQFGWSLDTSLDLPTASRSIPWAHEPQHALRYYQTEAINALIQHSTSGPCAIELPTGSGKTRCIHEMCKNNPVQTVIATPSRNITNQIYDEMVYLFGKKYVGKYGDGKKEIGKLFTVCTGQALVRLEANSEAYNFFNQTKQLVWDECHTTAAETFEKVCLGVLKHVPYRFFISATQMRGDGSGMLLKGITGPIVYSKQFTELSEEGFLAKPFFKIFHVPTHGFTGHRDANKETTSQLYLNPNVNRLAAEFAHKSVCLANRPTVILIEEFDQFLALKNYITIPFEFAHGGASNREYKDGTKLRDKLPKEYHESDVEGIVKRFNDGKTKLIIGTSAISMGIDLRPTGSLIYLQGGKSEVGVKQAIGRGTRVTADKKDLLVVDFKVTGSSVLERHADARIDIYKTMGQVEEINK